MQMAALASAVAAQSKAASTDIRKYVRVEKNGRTDFGLLDGETIPGLPGNYVQSVKLPRARPFR